MKRVPVSLIYITFIVLLFAGQPCIAQDYIVGESDLLTISVYDHPDLTTTARVGGDGSILMSLIGQVEVKGLTVSKISGKISGLLADGYIIDPQVTVFIKEFRSSKAMLMGEVNRPGLYELHGQTTFLELLSKAGGMTKNAGNKAIIKRKRTSGEKIITVNLKGLREKGETFGDKQILDGDSIYVEKAGVFYVTGEVKKPDAYRYEEGISIIKAITKAGGLTDLASAKNVRIIRKVNGKEKVHEKVSMDEPVLPEDVIVVPESFF